MADSRNDRTARRKHEADARRWAWDRRTHPTQLDRVVRAADWLRSHPLYYAVVVLVVAAVCLGIGMAVRQRTHPTWIYTYRLVRQE